MADPEDNPFVLRNCLIGRVQDGELTPDDAEAEAERKGLGTLQRIPSPDIFDPMPLDRWTLTMTLAWIAWREADAVREWWDVHQRECLVWRHRRSRIGFEGPFRDGHFLEQPRPPTVALLRMTEALDEIFDQSPPMPVPISTAVASLRRLLARGSVQAVGVHNKTGERAIIPAVDWPDLEISEDEGVEVLRGRESPHVRRYTDIAVDAIAARREWPAAAKLPDRPPNLVRPDGHGYMPLFCAVHWIASRGGAVDVGWDAEGWENAYADLLDRVAANEVELVGTRGGQRERIEPYELALSSIVYPWDDHIAAAMALGGSTALFSTAHADERLVTEGLGDYVRNADGPIWSMLLVRKEQVAKGSTRSAAAEPMTIVAGQGRPTSRPYVKAQFEARMKNGDVLPTLRSESK